MHHSKEEFERRTHERVRYRGHCLLISSNTSCEAYVINLSDSGALIAVLDEEEIAIDDNITLTIDLANNSSANLQGRIAHIKAHFIGLECHPCTDEDNVRLHQFLESANLPLHD